MSLADKYFCFEPWRWAANQALIGAVIFFILLFSVPANTVHTSRVTLAWDPSPSEGLSGYSIYYGTQSGVHTNRTFFGNVTNATVSGLVGGVTYFFVATATDLDGLESDFSNEVSHTVPLGLGPLTITMGPDGQISITGRAAPSTFYKLLASETLTQWRLVGTVTTDVQGTYQFDGGPSTTNRARFYRLQVMP